MSDLFWPTEAQMDLLRPVFAKSHGRPRVDGRRDFSEIIFINLNGLRWFDTPSVYGTSKTLLNRWKRWSGMGVFVLIMGAWPRKLPTSRRS